MRINIYDCLMTNLLFNENFHVSVPNQSSTADKGLLGGSPQSGGLADPLADPDKGFYENLPFHGMQNPPNKVSLSISVIALLVYVLSLMSLFLFCLHVCVLAHINYNTDDQDERAAPTKLSESQNCSKLCNKRVPIKPTLPNANSKTPIISRIFK